MARKSRTAVLKRQREVRKAEKAAQKREKRGLREAAEPVRSRVATTKDLEGYGFVTDASESSGKDDSDSPPPPALGPARARRGQIGRPRVDPAPHPPLTPTPARKAQPKYRRQPWPMSP